MAYDMDKRERLEINPRKGTKAGLQKKADAIGLTMSAYAAAVLEDAAGLRPAKLKKA